MKLKDRIERLKLQFKYRKHVNELKSQLEYNLYGYALGMYLYDPTIIHFNWETCILKLMDFIYTMILRVEYVESISRDREWYSVYVPAYSSTTEVMHKWKDCALSVKNIYNNHHNTDFTKEIQFIRMTINLLEVITKRMEAIQYSALRREALYNLYFDKRINSVATWIKLRSYSEEEMRENEMKHKRAERESYKSAFDEMFGDAFKESNPFRMSAEDIEKLFRESFGNTGNFTKQSTNKTKINATELTGPQLLSIKSGYKLFGSVSDPKTVYKKLSKKFHPDINPDMDYKYMTHLNKLYDEYNKYYKRR